MLNERPYERISKEQTRQNWPDSSEIIRTVELVGFLGLNA